MVRKIKKLSRLLFKRRNRLPEVIWFAVTNRCNLSCGMCQRQYANLIMEDMYPDVFRSILSKAPRTTRIFIMGGSGEPLLHEGFFKMAAELRAAFPASSTEFTTNGTLLTEAEVNNILHSGITHIAVSLENLTLPPVNQITHPADGHVIKNIQQLIMQRGGRKFPLVSIQAVLTKNNSSEIFNVVKEAKRLGVDFVRILRLQAWKKQDMRDLRPGQKEERHIMRKIRSLAKGIHLKIESSHGFNLMGRLTSHFDRFCVWTDDFIFVDVNGDIYPCCMLTGRKDMIMGNLAEEDLGAVWNGRRFLEFFSSQVQHCSFCDVLKYRQQAYI